MKGNGISIILALDFGFLTKCSKWVVSLVSVSVSFTLLAHCSFLFLYFSLSTLFCVKLKKKKNQCHKPVRLNSAHMTFPSSLIASIQFISASHARPQSIKHALLQRSSCPIITPIIKSAGIMGKAQPDDGRNKQVFNSGRKQIKASHSTIRLESRNTGALAQTEVWVSLHVQQV